MTGLFDLQLFRGYFTGLHGREPFPWQERLAEQVLTEGWPAVIDLPTASGKTACIDIAVFALACGRGPRRIFFVVDRKVIVDEAYEGRRKVAEKLAAADGGALGEIRKRLVAIGGSSTEPLVVKQLRGGVYRDESWVRSPLQPTVVASTVDQVGSRLLFRGYGIADSSLPIHAGLIGNDALILLDEAHCSKAFARTLERVARYRDEGGLELPFSFVEMTATPSRTVVEAPFRLDGKDRQNEVLRRRLKARKSTRFVATKAKADDAKKMAAELIRQAWELAERPDVKRVAVMVNRVDTARAVAEGLDGAATTVVLGRMRPVDRAATEASLDGLKSGKARGADDGKRFVVSTQCLEVGADLDFDGLVTELASMDALLQRFGRLNRLGDLVGGAHACIVAPAVDAKKADPIYGEALVKTRAWLEPLFAGGVERDFALEGDGASLPDLWRGLSDAGRREMSTPGSASPALLPAHLDALVQTSPKPEPEPAVEYFLHGKQNSSGEVSVVWRSDLDGVEPDRWAEIVALSPLTVGEALPVKIWALRAWMDGEEAGGQSDLEGDAGSEEAAWRRRGVASKPVLLLQGGEGIVASSSRDVRPGNTVVVPGTMWPAPALGHVPAGAAADVGDAAYFQGRGVVRLRLEAGVMASWPAGAREALQKFAGVEELGWEKFREAARAVADDTGLELPEWLRRSLAAIGTGREREFLINRYPDGSTGWVVESRKALRQMQEDSGKDDGSRGLPVSLAAHTKHVVAGVRELAVGAGLASFEGALASAATWHDTGKADERFQALLYGGDRTAAQLSPVLRAKGVSASVSERQRQRERSGLPQGFRHELLSLELAKKGAAAEPDLALILHLVASHHGYCRGFAPVVLDAAAEDVAVSGVVVTGAERAAGAAHRIGNGVPERFWELNRRFGWWGLAYLEGLLRLADWKASAAEQESGQVEEEGHARNE